MRVLLTVLGTNPQPGLYTLSGSQVHASLAPLALIELLPDAHSPDLVLGVCTAEAKRESWPLLEKALRDRCAVRAVDVPGGEDQDDVDAYLSKVAGAIPEGDIVLTMDVTHGYRHFSFLTYIAVLYVSALRRVQVARAYYGLLRRDEPSPFLDLRPLLELPQWLHVVQVMRETGSAVPMAEALSSGAHFASSRGMARELEQLSEAYLSGLPLELGRQVHRFLDQRPKPLEKALRHDHGLPLAHELVGGLVELLNPFNLKVEATGDGWKGKVHLSEDELRRQARIIDDLLERKSFATALGLMNEWTVSWVVWQRSEGRHWLDYWKTRRGAASALGAIAASVKDADLRDMLTPEQRDLGCYWSALSELRNAFHHHGMRPQVLVGDDQVRRKLQGVREYWRTTLSACPALSVEIGGAAGGRVLVSPIGRRPGVLFSALQASREGGNGDPTACLVLCSSDTEVLTQEALSRAHYDGPVTSFRLDDPYGGQPEVERLVHAARPQLAAAEEVLVNVTGGTTLMGLAAERFATTARNLARPVRRFGLIDRRPPAQQDADPYQVGEPFWLDGKGDDADNH